MKTPYCLLILIAILFSCQREQHFDFLFSSNFSTLKDNNENVEANIGVFGGSRKKSFSPVISSRVQYTMKDEVLMMHFDSGGHIKLMPFVLGLPSKWSEVSYITLFISSEQTSQLLFELSGSRSRLQKTLSLKKGLHSYHIDAREIPLLGGLENDILQLNFQLNNQGTIGIHQIKLQKSDEDSYLVDQWGQRKLVNFEGKIEKKKQLFTLPTENQFLDSLEFSYSIDAYGGIRDHNLSLDSTGFFYTEEIDNKWYLVSPSGNPFYSFGLNGVRRKSTMNNAALTRIKGRENLFEKLPKYNDCPVCFSPDSAYLSFYCQNVTMKYDNYEEWKNQTIIRLKKFGFNTIGNWSDTLFNGGQFPYTFTLDSRVFTNLYAAARLPDVFHPQWKHRLDSAFAVISNFSDDDFLLGYFVDNEIPWEKIGELDSTSHTYHELSQYPSFTEKQKAYAEQYFSIIMEVIIKHDPNHLYLGCRFTRNIDSHRAVANVAGKYLDVLSVNIYSPFTKKEMDTWYQIVKKPILIGEHHIPPQTQHALLPRYEAFPLDRRDEMVQSYLQTWISYPYAVGSHWYQYVDQELAGRGDGGENQPVGLVSVTDQLNKRLALVFYEFAKTVPQNYLK